MSNQTGRITILNKSDVKISATVAKYEKERYKDDKPITVDPNKSNSWERNFNKDYFCFIAESSNFYGFLCKGGVDYEYYGKAQMRLPMDNKLYELEYDISHIKHSLKILAVLEDVEISIYNQKENTKNPIHSQKIYKDTNFVLSIPDGYYYLRFKNDASNIVYGIIPGKSYYIAKAQILVDTNDNKIIKSHKDKDISVELELVSF